MRISDWSSDVCSSDLFKYANAMQVPRLEKVVVNMGVGEAVGDSKKVMAAVGDLTAITGQKPVVTRAKKAIANFKLREGMGIGAKVTLRRERMYEFLDRLVSSEERRVGKESVSRWRSRW